MRKLVVSFIFVVLLGSPFISIAGNNSYYVTENGSGSRNGLSKLNAWSVSDFNTAANWSTGDNPNKIDPGDTIYFSGEISSQISPAGSGLNGKYVTLDGYQMGESSPINGEDPGTALISTVEDITTSPDSTSLAAIYLEGNDYINIQDFRIKSCSGGIIISGSDYVSVKRNFIEEIRNEGIAVTKLNSEICRYITIGGAVDDGNLVHNAAWTTNYIDRDPKMINLYKHQDVVFSYNKVYGSGPSGNYASNIIEIHESNRTLIEYNDLSDPKIEAIISLKEYGPQNVIIRFNKIHGANNGGVNCGGDSRGGGSVNGAYIYGNEIYDNKFGIQVRLGAENIHIWSNIIRDNTRWGCGIFSFGGTPDNVRIYNNVFSQNTTDYTENPGPSRTGLYLAGIGSNGVTIKNNFFVDNRLNPNNTQYHQVYVESSITFKAKLEHNTYYNSKGQDGHFYWNGIKSLEQIQSVGQENESPKGRAGMPGFFDMANDNYILNGSSSGDGKALLECFNVTVQGMNYNMCYNDALDPRTIDWKTSPPEVNSVKQSDYSSWERGAYVYIENPTQTSIYAPKGVRIFSSNF